MKSRSALRYEELGASVPEGQLCFVTLQITGSSKFPSPKGQWGQKQKHREPCVVIQLTHHSCGSAMAGRSASLPNSCAEILAPTVMAVGGVMRSQGWSPHERGQCPFTLGSRAPTPSTVRSADVSEGEGPVLEPAQQPSAEGHRVPWSWTASLQSREEKLLSTSQPAVELLS